MAGSDPPIRAVIFDYGGVLTTSGRTALREWTREEGIRRETYSAALKAWLSRDAPHGTPIHRLETGEIDAEQFNELLAERLETEDGGPVAPQGLLSRLFAHMRDDPEMLQLVRDLRDAGVRTALLSNSWGNNYPWDRLAGLFEQSVVSGEVGLRKPDPRIYRLVLDKLGLPARQTAFVDDGSPNVEVAGQLGMRTVLHDGAAEGAARTRRLLADLLDELPPDPAQENS